MKAATDATVYERARRGGKQGRGRAQDEGRRLHGCPLPSARRWRQSGVDALSAFATQYPVTKPLFDAIAAARG